MADKEVRKLAAVMFTDIEGYTAFVQKDETEAMRKVSIHRKFLEQYTTAYNGKVIAFYGDGSLSIYESALDAVQCGIAMQKAYRGENAIPVRIGIHLGDIIFRDETVFGDGVNIASRLQTSGIPGSVFISDRIQTELANHPEIKTKSIGKKKLKNVAAQLEVFVVTNDGLAIPTGMTKMPELNKYYRYVPLLLLSIIAWWFINRQLKEKLFGSEFTEKSISVPAFINSTGDPSLDHVAGMAAHWITKELSNTPEANVVSSESANEMIQLAGMSMSTARGKKQFASLTGAVNIVEAFYTKTGANHDSMMMSGYIKNLETGKILQSLKDVKCNTSNPMGCIQMMSSNIKGYWASRDDHVLTPPNYDAYKAYLSARKAWRSYDKTFVFDQLKKAIQLDHEFIDPYFLMLDFFYNEKQHQEAYDTLQAMRKKFTDLDERETNMMNYHAADIEGKNKEVYTYFLKEYERDSMDMFTNNSGMVIAMMYRHDPLKALAFFNAIPLDSIQIEGCFYCGDRVDMAMWAALEADSMALADMLATKLQKVLYTRKNYGSLIMYYVWKNDTAKIDQLIVDSRSNPAYDETWEYLNYLASRLFLLRDNPEVSKRYAQKAIDGYSPFPKQIRMLGKSYYLNDQLDKALITLQQALINLPDETRTLPELGALYARMGNTVEAKKVIDQLELLRQPFDYGMTEYNQGRIYGLLGDTEQAVKLLDISISKGQKYDLWVTFDHDPDLLILKDDPGYKVLMSKFK